MTEQKPTEYQRTLFDKHGPEAANRVRTAIWLPVWGIIGGGITAALGIRGDFPGFAIVIISIAGAVISGAVGANLVSAASSGAGRFFQSFIQPSGNRTPYEQQFSYEDSLVMRGNAEGALASYESIIAKLPGAVQPRLRAAEICAKRKMYERAEGYYRGVQKLPGVAVADDVFASNRLVDLYCAWPGQENRALRELRRLIDTYPGSEVAKHARQGLATLKRQLGSTE